MPKKTTKKKGETTTGTHEAVSKKTPPRLPPPPSLMVVEKKKVDPMESLRRAEHLLADAIETYRGQYYHPANGSMNFEPFYNSIKALEDIYAEKGFLKSKRDLGYDWKSFCEEAIQAKNSLLQAVIDGLSEKAERMVTNPATPNFITQEEVNEIWEEAEEKTHLPGKIYGWSTAVRKLEARGLYDPNERKVRGGRQQGGSRR